MVPGALIRLDSWKLTAFDTLKASLTSAPVLAYPSRTGHFVLSTDASNEGLGAVLEQDQEQADGSI